MPSFYGLIQERTGLITFFSNFSWKTKFLRELLFLLCSAISAVKVTTFYFTRVIYIFRQVGRTLGMYFLWGILLGNVVLSFWQKSLNLPCMCSSWVKITLLSSFPKHERSFIIVDVEFTTKGMRFPSCMNILCFANSGSERTWRVRLHLRKLLKTDTVQNY